MKILVKILRVAHIPTDQLRAAAGLEDKEPWTNVIPKLKEAFGPLSPAIRFFKRDETMSLAGIEAISFDVPEANCPIAGFVNTEPIERDKVNRLDGQLLGELARLGIDTLAEKYEWRCFYEVKGN